MLTSLYGQLVSARCGPFALHFAPMGDIQNLERHLSTSPSASSAVSFRALEFKLAQLYRLLRDAFLPSLYDVFPLLPAGVHAACICDTVGTTYNTVFKQMLQELW